MKQRYLPKIMCSLLLADDNLTPFVGNARAVTWVEFQENPSNSSRDRAVNINCSTNKVPVTTELSQNMLLIVNNAYTVPVVQCKRKFLE